MSIEIPLQIKTYFNSKDLSCCLKPLSIRTRKSDKKKRLELQLIGKTICKASAKIKSRRSTKSESISELI